MRASPPALPCLLPVAFGAALLWSAPSAAAPAKTKRVTIKGLVSSVTHKRVYLEGTRGPDALTVGDKVRLYARRRRRGVCTIEHVAGNLASCTYTGRLSDDVSRFVARVDRPPADPADQAPLPPPPGPAFDGRDALAQAPHDKVGFSTDRVRFREGVTFPIEVALWQRSSGQGLSQGRMFHRSRLALAIHGAQLYVPGLRLHVQANIDGALVPADARYRKGENLRVEVHQLALSYRHPETFVAGAVGRFTPWIAPGVPLLDGAQAGVHLFSGLLEMGAYAGSIPSPTRLFPRFDHLTGGAYWAARYGQRNWFVSHRGRVGVVSDLGLSLRTEAEAHLSGRYGRWIRAAAGVRGGIGLDGFTPGVDLGYVQAESQPGFGLRLLGGYRYTAPGFSDYRPGVWPSLLSGLHHASAEVAWEQWDWFGLSMRAMGAATPAWALRAMVGPEIGVPRAFGGAMGAFLGWQEGVGHDPGRFVYSRFYLRPGFGASLSARAFYLDQAQSLNVYRAAGGSVSLEERVGWFSVWLQGRGEVPLPSLFGYAQPSWTLINAYADLGISATF